ncbi:autophagy-related 7 isoform X2 [Rhynchophorus ferrugineus]|uniref:autophagy-related 7 isoform X2 n=1 Tax=Rhynchophorus ferrugineus TaxID=354439 RepID=UPI003FCE3432
MAEKLKYVQAVSSVNPSFWNKLTELKLNIDKLDETPRSIWAFFTVLQSDVVPQPLLELDSTSFNSQFNAQNMYIPFKGKVINKNTVEDFKECNKMDLINSEGRCLYDNIISGAAIKDPALLNSFLLLSFADLKKYHYYYWFCFPVPTGITLEKNTCTLLSDEFPEDMIKQFYTDFQSLDTINKSYFLVEKVKKGLSLHTLSSKLDQLNPDNIRDFYFAFFNISNDGAQVGSQLRNYVALVLQYWIAEKSVYLNLKLMKWRIVPDINLDKIENARCLLIGAGTLGCAVARCLLGWGVRNITLADNGHVSPSNPVRQSLFSYEDAIAMKPKSEAAAEALKKIFPGVNANGVYLNVPMPGHTIGESVLQQTVDSVQILTDLVQSNDIIFLLMDSRESRWLPTLLGTYYKKIVINSALGFDSYLVMRHGCISEVATSPDPVINVDGYKIIRGENLGCYFCNDITAPGDSMKNRTLDQQCTVTRPGVAQIAGALAVELAVSILQHDKGLAAPAFFKVSPTAQDLDPEDESQCILGLIPHSIRGFLCSFNQILPATMKYDKCVACSDAILNEYKENGIDFLLKVFNSSKHLEDVTKLTDMFKDINLDEVLEFSDEDFD